jgi:hypothetical protein
LFRFVLVRQRRIKEFKASNGHCTDEEWEQILISTLVQPDGPHAGDVEVKADVKADVEEDDQSGYVTLRFRKNIQGIKVCNPLPNSVFI